MSENDPQVKRCSHLKCFVHDGEKCYRGHMTIGLCGYHNKTNYLEQSCLQCNHHQSNKVAEVTYIRCHREVHSDTVGRDHGGYYPLVATIEASGNGYKIGSCSYYDPIKD